MSPDEQAGPESGPDLLDLRSLRKPDRHPTVFAAFRSIGPGEAIVLINDHDPRHLRDDFEADHAGTFEWEYLTSEPGNWRIRITKLTSAPLPRELTNTRIYTGIDSTSADPDPRGAVWRLQVQDRDLDANVVAIPAGGGIGRHVGPDLDVLVHVISGSGRLLTELGPVELEAGSLVWLPKRSTREFTAGQQGLRYLTVHKRRTDALTIRPAGPRDAE